MKSEGLKTMRFYSSFYLCLLALGLLAYGAGGPAWAQSAASDKAAPPQSPSAQTRDAMPPILQTPIHLHLGTTTMQAAAQALAAQTGLHIQVDNCLQARKLLVEMDNLTAQDALDTLAELGDWRWFRKEDGTIWLARKRVVIPQTIADLPACLRAALPRDYRTFLGVSVELKDLPERPNDLSQNAWVPVSRMQPRVEHASRAASRLGRLAWQQSQQLYTEFLPFVADDKTLSWRQLTERQLTAVNDMLLLDILGGWFHGACNTDYISLLNDGLLPYQRDIDAAEFTLYHGSYFTIGSVYQGGETGFGAIIPGLKSTDPRLPTLKNPLPPE